MITIENITKREDERLNKFVRTETLLHCFFNNILITGTSTLISVREK